MDWQSPCRKGNIVRGLLLALLIGNVVYFVWQLVGYRHQQAVIYHADESRELLDGERLMLVSEREKAAQQPIEPMPLPVPDIPEANTEEAATVAAGEAAVDASVAEDGAVAHASDAAPAVTEIVTEDSQQQEALIAAGQCLYLGAFATPEQQHAYQQRINAVGITAAAIGLEVAGAVDYWVHIKPFANRQQAVVKLRELQSKQIDSFIIPQGPFQNGISLGVFDRRENAEKRQQEIAAKGYSAEIGINQKMMKEQWLMLDHENSTKFSQSLFLALKNDFSFVEIKKDACKSVAR